MPSDKKKFPQIITSEKHFMMNNSPLDILYCTGLDFDNLGWLKIWLFFCHNKWWNEVETRLSHVTTATYRNDDDSNDSISNNQEKNRNSIVQVNHTVQQKDNVQFGLLIIWNYSLLQKQLLKICLIMFFYKLLTVLQVYLLLCPCSQDHRFPRLLHPTVVLHIHSLRYPAAWFLLRRLPIM